jgi:hypothetical protein
MSYYLMHRGWLDHPAFGAREKEPLCRAAAWAWLVEHAAFAPTRVRIGGAIVTLQRGQLSHSLRHMGQAWGWQHDRVRRFLRELEAREMVDFDSETAARATAQTVITICNYRCYQDGDLSRATAHNDRATAMRQQCDSSCDSNATARATAQPVITICINSDNRDGQLSHATANNADARQQKNGTEPESATRENQGNQVKKDSKNLKRGLLGRDAPSGGLAPPDPEPPATSNARPKTIEPDTPGLQPPGSDLTPEMRAEMVERLDRLKTEINGNATRVVGVHDPVAYKQAVTTAKRENWLRSVHAFASERFEGDARWEAWEAIETARRAGSREATPQDISNLLDSINKLRLAEQKIAA